MADPEPLHCACWSGHRVEVYSIPADCGGGGSSRLSIFTCSFLLCKCTLIQFHRYHVMRTGIYFSFLVVLMTLAASGPVQAESCFVSNATAVAIHGWQGQYKSKSKLTEYTRIVAG